MILPMNLRQRSVEKYQGVIEMNSFNICIILLPTNIARLIVKYSKKRMENPREGLSNRM